ncbi:hypothetical protein MAR_015069 [Mya arenaria]|uniref:DZIP3-like HEPN domain-containing protein n=1 Tax=Mya arenaria TaxID=6604 RepID=A0ABY7FG02_MYAAR|nr:hypothetical protein MAR_015069 [Mya arenaria]
MPDTDNYYRLVTFIINTCASVLRRLFLEQARICAGTSFTTVQAYLRTRQRDIDKLKMKKIISKKQYELLFPSAVPVDENNWDISLLSVLIKNLYPTVQSTVITDVLAIRDVRNNMQHIANTAHISYSDFDKNWKALRSACLRIALFTKGRVYEEEIEKEIEASLTNSMPNLGDSLRQWYTREFAESLYKRIDELSEEIRELRKDTSKASATLNAVITKRPSATAHGKPFKRIKATTPISERPFDEFRKFMTTEMTPNIQPHVDCTEIKNRISTRRIAVITGYGGSHYIHTTAHAIRELNLKEELCTLITDPSDWKHINPMELQLVLFKCPFGDSEPNEEKARVMFDVMDSIKQTLLDDKCNMFVVVLSQTEVMRAAIEIIGKSHDLLEDPVTCHKENTKLDPDIIGQELTDAYKTRPVTLTFVTDLRLLQEEKDEEESNITGMTVVEDRFLVATDWKKKCLRCFDIDIVSPSGQLKFEKKIKGGAGCKGIVYSNDQLVVSYIDPGSNVHILDMEGNISKVFQKNDAGDGKDEGNLRCLRDITVDSTGRVYVCGEDSHTVCLVSSETGPITRLLGEEDDVRWPLAVAVFDKTSNLYVGMRASKINAFDCLSMCLIFASENPSFTETC